jgi:uncharacterized membrane protein
VTVTMRPLTVGELLDRTFLYYRTHFLMFVGISALPGSIMLLFQLGIALVPPSGPLVSLIASLASYVLTIVASTVAQGATMVAVSQIQLGRDASATEAFRQIRPRIGELVILALNITLRIVIGFILLIVPGVIVALRYALAAPVAVLEEKGVNESLERSRDLTRGHLGRILLIYCLLVVLILAGYALWQVPMMLVVLYTTGSVVLPTWATVVMLAGNFVVQSIVSPISVIALALVYYDERVRKEAFDLDHLMQELDGTGLKSTPL